MIKKDYINNKYKKAKISQRKNITNQITKYQIEVSASVKFKS